MGTPIKPDPESTWKNDCSQTQILKDISTHPYAQAIQTISSQQSKDSSVRTQKMIPGDFYKQVMSDIKTSGKQSVDSQKTTTAVFYTSNRSTIGQPFKQSQTFTDNRGTAKFNDVNDSAE